MARRAITAIQPDYDKWLAVDIGMGFDEVVALLGKPRSEHGNRRTPGKPYYLCFGMIEIPYVPKPCPYRFTVGFDKHERLWMKSDPFGGELSRAGVPSKPRIITPIDGSVFQHFPRVLDVRWGPVSGNYPMTYEVEVAATNIENEYSIAASAREIPGPYFLFSHVGAGNGRIRVRGCNAIGVGEWSDYVGFMFLH